MDLTSYRRGQLEKLGVFYGISNAGSMTRDELVEVLTPIAQEADLTDVPKEPEPPRGITTSISVESPGDE